MRIPRLLAGGRNAITLAFFQLCVLFMANDWWVVGAYHGENGAVFAAIVGPILVTLLLVWNLAAAATFRGCSRAWGLFAFLGLIGAVVVHFLPGRTGGVGFPIEPHQR